MNETLKQRSLKSIFWAVGESVATATVSLGVFLVLARLLEPQDFGVVALAGSFILLFNLITGHTFSEALIQVRTLEPDHGNSAFWSTVALACALAGLCTFGAERIAGWVNEPDVAPLLAWLALMMPLNSIGSVQAALLRRDLRFKEIAATSLLGRSVGAAAGLAMAFLDYGAWSLVAQQLVGALITNIALAVVSSWRPELRFSGRHFNELARFGLHVSASQLISGSSEQVMNLMVGTLYGSLILGYFNLAWRTVQLVRMLISTPLYHVGFSAFSQMQGDKTALSAAFCKATQISCLVGFPMAIGIALVADPLITAVYGVKWQASIPILTILALHLMPSFFGMFITASYRANGRPSWVLYLTTLDLAVGIGGVYAIAPLPVEYIAVFWTAKSLALVPLHAFLLSRLLEIPVSDILRPTFVPLAAGITMAAPIVLTTQPFVQWAGLVPGLIIVSGLGILLYGVTLRLIAPDVQRYALTTLWSIVSTKMKRA